ncbi:MAG: GspE/PulE family protein [Anaerohalosphaeraceae bacterium]|nr:GspE/PulE family protein [Anaerohalosphaeraceae bacterium]
MEMLLLRLKVRNPKLMNNQQETISYIRQNGILSTQQLTELLDKQSKTGKSIIALLKEYEHIKGEKLTRIIAASHKIEFINLSPDDIDPMAARMIPSDICNEHNLIGVRLEGKNFYVAMSSPMNLAVRDQIEVRCGSKVVPLAAVPEAISSAIRYHFSVQSVTKQTIASMRLKKDDKKDAQEKTEFLKEMQDKKDPISNLVSYIITGAIDARASDIHIEPQESDMKIRYRVDGVLHKEIDIPVSAQAEVLSHIKILANMDISEKRIPQDGHISTMHNDREYDLRVSSLPSVTGEKIVLRILDKSNNKWDLDAIVTSKQDNFNLRKLIENPYGMILMTGPTGSGKTTTLYSLLQLLNTGNKNIITVEDPVEYRLDGITQVQVNARAGLTFASALRSILRQDPDVILIGEIRDLETAEIAVSAAMTGHLVLSTLHTNDAAGAISRFLNIGMPPFLLASSLLGSVAQRLMRTSCENCKESFKPNDETLKMLKNVNPEKDNFVLHKSKGCDMCNHTGYLGRKGIYEILPVTNKIEKMIINGLSDTEIKETAISDGMRTLRASGFDEVFDGNTTIDELRRIVDMEDY